VGTLTDNSTTGSSVPTTINQSGTGLTIGTISGSYGSVVNFTGTGSTTVNATWGSTGQLIRVSDGTVINNGGRNTYANIQLDGGILNMVGDRLGMNAAIPQTLVINGGQLTVTGTYGIRLNGDNGAGSAGGTSSVTGSQTGGKVTITQGNLSLGSTSAGTTAYSLSGGILATPGVVLGNVTSGAGTSVFTLSGTGKLLSSGTVVGNQGAGAIQNFIVNGGTLAASAIDMTKLTTSGATAATPATLFNNGGILAPGDIGAAGKTTITGSYSNAPSAVLAIDIGGTSQGSAFTNAPGYYDTLSVTVGAVLDGRLYVSLINGYVPASTATKFTVLTSTGLSGSFSNVTAGKVWTSDGYSRFDVLTPANTVVLSNYVVNAWSPTSGSTWDTAANWSLATEPNNSAFGAYFGMGGSGTVTLDTAHTVRGLTFTNSSASYTIAGAALTLQGDALTAPKLSVLAGSHIISAAMALSNATEIAVATGSVLSLTGGITGGQAVTKTGTGTLALSNVNTLGALTVSAGTVRFATDATTVSALTMTAGATCDFTAGTLYILKNGGGTDTIEKVNAAITANSITLRGKTAVPVDFKVTEEDGYIKVTAKIKGTMIMMM
jgi:hypothetical protein